MTEEQKCECGVRLPSPTEWSSIKNTHPGFSNSIQCQCGIRHSNSEGIWSPLSWVPDKVSFALGIKEIEDRIRLDILKKYPYGPPMDYKYCSCDHCQISRKYLLKDFANLACPDR